MEVNYLRLVTFTVGLWCILTLSAVTSRAEDKVKDYVDHLQDEQHAKTLHRYKRFAGGLGGGGGEACLQVYTVPKNTLLCDPSPQVTEELNTFQESLQAQVTSLEQLKTKLDTLDPNQPRELPPEVRERLDTIVTVRETQAGHQEVFKRLEDRIQGLVERITQIESADRHQVARLIEEQTRLIKVTMHQSNRTLHEEYVDRLTESTRDLTDKLRQLEDNLKSKIEEAETKLEESVQQSEVTGKQNIDETKVELNGKISAFRKELSQEQAARQTYQVKTDENAGEVENLSQLLTTLREHQTSYEQDKEQLRGIIMGLRSSLSEERVANEQLREQVSRLNVSLRTSQHQFEQFMHQLASCKNRSDSLDDHLLSMQRRLEEREHIMPRILKVSDCQDALAFFYPTTGVYPVNPGQAGDPFDVYCDMDDRKGWTVLMRRQDGTLDFFRDWMAYKNGFGELDGEHWLGLEKIHALTSRKQYKLHIDLQDWQDKWWYAKYDSFYVDGEESGYKLHVSGYHGDAGDSLHFHNGMGFSTFDKSHDLNDGICARWCHGGWWYRDCFTSNLNGRYYATGAYKTTTGWGDGVVWRTLEKTNFYSVKAVVMKIAPFDKGGVHVKDLEKADEHTKATEV